MPFCDISYVAADPAAAPTTVRLEKVSADQRGGVGQRTVEDAVGDQAARVDDLRPEDVERLTLTALDRAVGDGGSLELIRVVRPDVSTI